MQDSKNHLRYKNTIDALNQLGGYLNNQHLYSKARPF